jgi:ATP-dependent Lhr-like helicase
LPVFRGNGAVFPSADQEEQARSPAAKRISDYLAGRGASFFGDIRTGTGLSLDALNTALAELFWSGRISNDVFHELLSLKRSAHETTSAIEPIRIVDPRHNSARGRLLGKARRSLRQVPGWSGRWFLTHDRAIEGEPMAPEQRSFAVVRQLLNRYGILAREFLGREVNLAWTEAWPALQALELRGEIRRGYFVEGLSGMQYALPEAAEELRSILGVRGTKDSSDIILVGTCDPSNPFGPGVDIPAADGAPAIRVSRLAGNYIAFIDGSPVMLFESSGTRVLTIGHVSSTLMEQALRAFIDFLRLPESERPFKEIIIEYWNGSRPAALPEAEMLRRLGFQRDRNQTVRIDAYSL